MGTYTVTQTMRATPTAIWNVLDDFANIASWSQGVASSKGTNGIARGVGAERRCEFDAKGKNWAQERITDRTADSMAITIYETNAPMERFDVEIHVLPKGDGAEVSFNMDIVVKGGPLGVLMEKTMVAGKLKCQIGQLLLDLEARARSN